MTNFEKISSAIIYTLWLEDKREAPGQEKLNACVNFVNAQFSRLPDYLHLPFNALSKGLNTLSVLVRRKRFCNLSQNDRLAVLRIWSSLPGPAKDFILAFDTLLQFYFCSLATENDEGKNNE